jgi:hypothetical protein
MLRVSAAAMLAGVSMQAAGLEFSIEIPRLNVAEYHRPYVAVWIEKPDQSVAVNLAVWYQLQDNAKGEKGTTWLKDLRTWWRKSGREMTVPPVTIASPTRPPGIHTLGARATQAATAQLQPGEYRLVVESAREVGGREIVRVPFQWPPSAPKTAQASGSHEVGQVQLTVKP